MSFISILDKIASVGKTIFTTAVTVAQAAEPEVDLFFPTIAPLYNMTVTLVGNAEMAAAAAGANKAGKQKSALVIAALLPYAVQEARNLGISDPTAAQLQGYVDTVVAGLKVLGAIQ